MAKSAKKWSLEELKERDIPVDAIMEQAKALQTHETIYDSGPKIINQLTPEVLRRIVDESFTKQAVEGIVADAKSDAYEAIAAVLFEK